MELSSSITKPSVRTCLCFSEKEVVEALMQYAMKQGYVFDVGDIGVWYPNQGSSGRMETTLVLDKEGATESTISISTNKN